MMKFRVTKGVCSCGGDCAADDDAADDTADHLVAEDDEAATVVMSDAAPPPIDFNKRYMERQAAQAAGRTAQGAQSTTERVGEILRREMRERHAREFAGR